MGGAAGGAGGLGAAGGSRTPFHRIGGRGLQSPLGFRYSGWGSTLDFEGVATLDPRRPDHPVGTVAGMVRGSGLPPVATRAEHEGKNQGDTAGPGAEHPRELHPEELIAGVYYPQAYLANPSAIGHSSPVIKDAHFHGTFTTRYNARESAREAEDWEAKRAEASGKAEAKRKPPKAPPAQAIAAAAAVAALIEALPGTPELASWREVYAAREAYEKLSKAEKTLVDAARLHAALAFIAAALPVPDGWKLRHFGRTDVDLDAAAPGGNGSTVLENYFAGTDPNDYYDHSVGRIAAVLAVAGGDAQTGEPAGFLAQALAVLATDSRTGEPLANAPIIFSVTQGTVWGGALAAELSAFNFPLSTLTVRTDAQGLARAHYLQPAAMAAESRIEAAAAIISHEGTKARSDGAVVFTAKSDLAGASVKFRPGPGVCVPGTRVTVAAEFAFPPASELVVRYTTDGSEPTDGSPIFPQEGVHLKSGAAFRARPFAGGFAGEAREGSYEMSKREPDVVVDAASGPGADFATLQEAWDATNAGGASSSPTPPAEAIPWIVVGVRPGSYEGFSGDQSSHGARGVFFLALTRPGEEPPTVTGGVAVEGNAGGLVAFEGFAFKAGMNVGGAESPTKPSEPQANVCFTNCHFDRGAGGGNAIKARDADVSLVHCTAVGSGTGVSLVDLEGSHLFAKNSVLWGGATAAVAARAGSQVKAEHSIVRGWGGTAGASNPNLTPAGWLAARPSPAKNAAEPGWASADIHGYARPAAEPNNSIIQSVNNSIPCMGCDEWLDGDGDGLPDWYEALHGIDESVRDHALLDSGNRVPHLFMFLNGYPPSPPSTPGECRPTMWVDGKVASPRMENGTMVYPTLAAAWLAARDYEIIGVRSGYYEGFGEEWYHWSYYPRSPNWMQWWWFRGPQNKNALFLGMPGAGDPPPLVGGSIALGYNSGVFMMDGFRFDNGCSWDYPVVVWAECAHLRFVNCFFNILGGSMGEQPVVVSEYGRLDLVHCTMLIEDAFEFLPKGVCVGNYPQNLLFAMFPHLVNDHNYLPSLMYPMLPAFPTSLNVKNSILWKRNGERQAISCDLYSQADVQDSIVSGWEGTLAESVYENVTGNAVQTADPLLNRLGWLTAGSPAIGAAAPGFASVDLYGQPRPAADPNNSHCVGPLSISQSFNNSIPLPDIGCEEYACTAGDGIPDWWKIQRGIDPAQKDHMLRHRGGSAVNRIPLLWEYHQSLLYGPGEGSADEGLAGTLVPTLVVDANAPAGSGHYRTLQEAWNAARDWDVVEVHGGKHGGFNAWAMPGKNVLFVGIPGADGEPPAITGGVGVFYSGDALVMFDGFAFTPHRDSVAINAAESRMRFVNCLFNDSAMGITNGMNSPLIEGYGCEVALVHCTLVGRESVVGLSDSEMFVKGSIIWNRVVYYYGSGGAVSDWQLHVEAEDSIIRGWFVSDSGEVAPSPSAFRVPHSGYRSCSDPLMMQDGWLTDSSPSRGAAEPGWTTVDIRGQSRPAANPNNSIIQSVNNSIPDIGCDEYTGDALPTWWKRKHFGNTEVDPGANVDGLALTNAEAYRHGIKISSPRSVVSGGGRALQAALEGAESGGIITVKSGTYEGVGTLGNCVSVVFVAATEPGEEPPTITGWLGISCNGGSMVMFDGFAFRTQDTVNVDNATLRFVNCLFDGNSMDMQYGGWALISAQDVDLSLVHCTLVGDWTLVSAYDSTVFVKNSVLWNEGHWRSFFPIEAHGQQQVRVEHSIVRGWFVSDSGEMARSPSAFRLPYSEYSECTDPQLARGGWLTAD